MAYERQLALDRDVVQWMNEGIEIKFHVPEKDEGPVICPEFPWEGNRVMVRGNSPVWCEERSSWRIWYNGGDELLPMYAESEDGLRWEKPELGIVSWRGSRKNNIVDLGFNVRSASERCVAIVEDRRQAGSSQRFKGLTRVSGRLISLVSPDGLRWKPLEGASSVRSDDEFRVFFDPRREKFAATLKMMGAPVPELGRSVAVSFSDDFMEWTEPELVFWADEVDRSLGKERIERVLRDSKMRSPLEADSSFYFTDVYNMGVFYYNGLYIGLPVLFNQSGVYWYAPKGVEPPTLGSNQDGILYPLVALSRDLFDWERPVRTPFIPLSPLSDRANYDYGSIQPCAPVRKGDELWFYYSGRRFSHLRGENIELAGLRASPEESDGAVFRAKLRVDGFASFSAGYDAGVFLSRPVEVKGSALHINASAPNGEVRAELRDAATGKVIPGFSMGDFLGDRYYYSEDGKSRHLRFGTGARLRDDVHEDDSVPFTGDSADEKICWKKGSGLDALRGRKVRVCLYLRNADVYSFWFND